MDANELIKQAPEILKVGGEIAGALKLTDIVKAMLGPATDELAERWRDSIRRLISMGDGCCSGLLSFA